MLMNGAHPVSVRNPRLRHFLKGRVIRDQVVELRSERALARACGFDFRVGVRSEEHKEALGEEAPDLRDLIVVMDWC